jgi:hypothetical protein
MSTIRANTLLAADGSTTTEPSIPALDQRMAKAWVNFNGTGTVAIRDSYNVSSITDNGTGSYSINFTTSLSNANYSVSGMCEESGTGYAHLFIDRTYAISTSSVHIQSIKENDSYYDATYVMAHVLGN